VSKSGKDVYCYFDHDEQGFGLQNAQTLNQMIQWFRSKDTPKTEFK
jgi:uncharacterized protein YecE (DUF72 family)